MFFGRNISSDIYQRAFDQFMFEVKFYGGEARDYLLDLSSGERMLALCLFILFLIYLIVTRARRKYNPGSLGRQFVTAVFVVAAVVYGGGILFDTTPGAYSGMFRL